MPILPRQRLTELLPILGAAVVGVVALAVALVVPTGWIESLVWRTGLDAILPMAEPPLGTTARVALALGGGLGSAAVTWAALFLLWGPGGTFAPRDGTAPAVRRADAHPDAPPRAPLTAAELGEPLPPPATARPMPAPPPSERAIPADLDQPLAAFDPAAVPAVPREPVRPVPPLAPASPRLDAGERIETFDLSPRRPGSDQPSIEQLLRRLEQGAVRRPVRAG